jgi:hypothetical protein
VHSAMRQALGVPPTRVETQDSEGGLWVAEGQGMFRC